MANTKKRSKRKPKRKGKSNLKIVRFNIHPLILITSLFLLLFIGGGLLNQSPSIQSISIDEFLRAVKQNEYSRLLIQDTGEILAQSKYLQTAVVDSGTIPKLDIDKSDAAEKASVENVTLSKLVTRLKPVDPIKQLQTALTGEGDSQISEVIVFTDFIIARTAGIEDADLFVSGVTEVEFFTELRDQGISRLELAAQITFARNAQEEISSDSFTARFNNGEYGVVYRIDDTVYGRMNETQIPSYSLLWDGGIESFAETLQREGISLSSDFIQIGSTSVASIPWGDIISLVTLVGFVFLGFILFRSIQSSGNGLMKFGQSKARMFWGVKPDVTFADVAGIDEAKEELEEIVQFLRTPDKFLKLGARIPKGVLMVGPPGTGKTLLARAIAGEAGVPFFHTSGSEFEEMLVGAGASRVRDLFEKAKKTSPSLIFIDEIDAVARKRGTTMQSGTTEQTLNQILVEMDGFEKNVNVIVIAATNRPDVLDPAILRPGRFDRRVMLDLPDIDGREQILAIHAKGKPLATDVDLSVVAKRTVGFAGAELENTLNEAAIIAAKREGTQVTAADIEEAATKVTMGPAKRSRRRKEDELKLVAVHEAGHAVVSKYVENSMPIHKVSIISRGMAGGVTHFLPKDDNPFQTKKDLTARIIVSLGGRAAEDIVLGDVSTGASSDINSATNIARNMVQKFGMSEKLGLIKYGETSDSSSFGYGYGEPRDYSDDTANIIDEEVRTMVDAAYQEALSILNKNRGKLDKLVELLLEKEVVESEEFEGLFS